MDNETVSLCEPSLGAGIPIPVPFHQEGVGLRVLSVLGGSKTALLQGATHLLNRIRSPVKGRSGAGCTLLLTS